MRGGKREGAGRKGYGKTKIYRLPIALEPDILRLVEDYKASFYTPKEKTFDSVTKSKQPEKPIFPILNKEQLKHFRSWLIKYHFVKSAREARKKTENPRLCKNTFLEYISIVGDGAAAEIEAIAKLYVID